jgi:hypothetical protein
MVLYENAEDISSKSGCSAVGPILNLTIQTSARTEFVSVVVVTCAFFSYLVLWRESKINLNFGENVALIFCDENEEK